VAEHFVTAEELERLMAEEAIAPGVYVYPADRAAEARLAGHCAALGIDAPVRWHAGLLHWTVRDLTRARGAVPPAPDAALIPQQAKLTGLHGTVVAICAQSAATLKGLMQRYKEDGGPWPVFCMITPMSLDMSLALLFEHLGEDRVRENHRRRILEQRRRESAGNQP
jgi:hypothetical protein